MERGAAYPEKRSLTIFSLGMASHAALRSSSMSQGDLRRLKPRKNPWKAWARERSRSGFLDNLSTSTGLMISPRISISPFSAARTCASGSLIMTM